jgi:hypothetical protein
MPNAENAACIACGRDSNEVPLIALDYQGARHWICPQHLPVLIHEPARLTGKLPGAESMRPAETHD